MIDGLEPARWQAIEPLLDAALDLQPAARDTFLDSACGDPVLRAEVKLLLASCVRAEGWLAESAPDLCAGLIAEPELPGPAEGERIGPYRIVGEAGRGGMGTVYIAERDDDQYRKRVALKLVRGGRGLDGQLVRRFVEERQILASLDHPNIARLLDGGVTAEGCPWFAMEFVAGLSLDRYCDAHRLSIERRLALFLDACDAVQYAHRNLVVHRDLKPSNILVTGAGEVKLLDFGIAKLLAQSSAAERSPVTQTGLRLLTPEYASPEQIRGEPVSTTSDVYSLGVVLFGLLTGGRPYPLVGRAPGEIERAVLGAEPERPSAAAIRAPVGAAAARGLPPERLRRVLRGDLETIVLMALRKEPERRYLTVEQLAADLQRYLDGRPVTARRNSWGYRAGKFVRRHPAGIAAAIGLTVLLVGFGVVTGVQSARTVRERDKATQLAGFLTELFAAPDPWRSRGQSVTAREMLDSGAVRLDRQLRDQPGVRTELLSVIGRSYMALGLLDGALTAFDSAVAVGQRYGLGDGELAESRRLRAAVILERGDFTTAESLGRDGLARARRRLGATDPGALPELIFLGNVLNGVGKWAEAESHFREALAIERGARRDSVLLQAEILASLAHLRWLRGDPAEAEALFREALAVRRGFLGEQDPSVGSTQIELAKVLHSRGDPTATALLRQGLDVIQRAMGKEAPLSAYGMIHLAAILVDEGQPIPAESLYREALGAQRRVQPAGSATMALVLTGLGRVVLDRGDAPSAEGFLREALAFYRKNAPTWQYAETLELLGAALTARGSYREAEPLLLESYAARKETWGEHHERTEASVRRLIQLYDRWGKRKNADAYRMRLADGG